VLNVQVTEVSVHAVLDCSSVMRWMVIMLITHFTDWPPYYWYWENTFHHPAWQWHRQDWVRGGAKLEISTHSKLQGRVQQLLDD